MVTVVLAVMVVEVTVAEEEAMVVVNMAAAVAGVGMEAEVVVAEVAVVAALGAGVEALPVGAADCLNLMTLLCSQSRGGI